MAKVPDTISQVEALDQITLPSTLTISATEFIASVPVMVRLPAIPKVQSWISSLPVVMVAFPPTTVLPFM